MLPMAACTSIQGNAQLGTYSYVSLGGNATNYAQTPGGVTAEAINNADSFREVSSTIRSAVYTSAAAAVAKNLSNNWAGVKNTETAATVSNAAGSEATSQAAIKAAAETEAIRITTIP